MARKWGRWLALFCLCAPLCRTQQLATTDDGRQVLLSTYWQLAGEPYEFQHFGIYRSAENRWSLVAHTDQGPYLGRPFLSGDGSVTGWDRINPCFGSCIGAFPRSVTEFQGLTAPISIGTYALALSRNTRFVLSPGFLGVTDFGLQDLTTGQTWTPPAVPYLRTFGVAGDGTVIGLAAGRSGGFTTAFVPNRVMVWRPGAEAREIFQADNVLSSWISSDGSRALIETGRDQHQSRELWWVDIARGIRQQIAQLSPDASIRFLDPANHQIANDGNRVLYFWPSQNSTLWLWEPGGDAPHPVANAAEGFLNAVLSGDGHIAWAFTASGRLMRIAIDSGATEEVLGALPPRLFSGYAGSAPGSAMVWRADQGITPGLKFSSGGLVFPVIDETSRDSVAIQIPWEAPPENPPLIVQREGDPFELALPMFVETRVRPVMAGEVDKQGNFQIKAALQNFSGLVTSDHPAPAGSTIHTWFYNLGPLDQPVPTGAPGPNDPAAVPLAPLGCFLLTAPATPGRPVEIAFLAYAPGLVGVYQADLTIPADFPAGPGLLICDSRGVATAGWLPVGPAQ